MSQVAMQLIPGGRAVLRYWECNATAQLQLFLSEKFLPTAFPRDNHLC